MISSLTLFDNLDPTPQSHLPPWDRERQEGEKERKERIKQEGGKEKGEMMG